MMDYYGYGTGLGWVLVLGVIGLVVVAAVIVAAVLLVRRPPRSAPSPRSGGDDALRILEGRFARGEIDQEEFEQRRDTLTRPAPR